MNGPEDLQLLVIPFHILLMSIIISSFIFPLLHLETKQACVLACYNVCIIGTQVC